MKKLLKPASLLLYFETLLVFFLAGMSYAGITGAGQNQGLAGGAIVFGYGVGFALIAFVCAVILAAYATHRTVVVTNRVLAVVFAAFIAVLGYRFFAVKNTNTASLNTTATPGKSIAIPASFTSYHAPDDITDTPMGLGFFKPNFFDHPVLYFYGNLNLEKPIQEHPPFDSVTFKHTEYGSYDISYAPPWLVPDHLKLDYDILYFKIRSIGRDFAEITVNTHTQQTTFVSLSAGKILYWPDFLLGIHSVELIPSELQKIRFKPLLHAGEVNTPYQFIRPIRIQDEWMMVELQDGNFKRVDEGWIRWRKNNSLLITYSLLS